MTNIRNLFAAWAGLLLGLNLCAQNTPFDSIPFELETDHWVLCELPGEWECATSLSFRYGAYRSGDRPQYSIC